VNRRQFKQWLKRLYETSEKELNCDQFQASLPALVEFEIAGGAGQDVFAAARAHLQHCADCAEEYEALREVARLEMQSRLPTMEESLRKFESMPEAEQREPA
jgi:hypothetical protein